MEDNKCFARDLGNCSKKISNEHIFSKVMLKSMFAKGFLNLTGPVWLGTDEFRNVSINSFSSSVLCTNHNSILSTLDNIMETLIKSLLFYEEKNRYFPNY